MNATAAVIEINRRIKFSLMVSARTFRRRRQLICKKKAAKDRRCLFNFAAEAPETEPAADVFNVRTNCSKPGGLEPQLDSLALSATAVETATAMEAATVEAAAMPAATTAMPAATTAMPAAATPAAATPAGAAAPTAPTVAAAPA